MASSLLHSPYHSPHPHPHRHPHQQSPNPPGTIIRGQNIQPINQPIRIGDYLLSHEIGRGSFATVYLASGIQVVKNNGRGDLQPTPFAVKSVSKEKLNKKLAENLQSEIKILQGLKHPNIVQLVDVVNTEQHIHLIMEFCSMGDLSSFIKRKGLSSNPPSISPNYFVGRSGGLAEFLVRHFLDHIVKAMVFLRQNSLIHRDLKPQNLLLSQPLPGSKPVEINPGLLIPALPTLKLADFGFARSLSLQDMASTLCGSPLYMAPEVLRGDKYDAKADLWSLGAILYEMIYGKPPFKSQNHIDLLKKIDRGDGTIRFPDEDDKILHDVLPSGSSQTPRHIAPLSMRLNRASPNLAASYARNTSLDAMTSSNAIQSIEDLKNLLRHLLKRNPIERMSFEEFFLHPAVHSSTPKDLYRQKKKGLKALHLEEYVFVEKGGVEVNWFADEVENRVSGVQVSSTNDVLKQAASDTDGINTKKSNPEWGETFKSDHGQSSELAESMHRFLDAPVDPGVSGSPAENLLAMVNRCARRGQVIHWLANERLIVAKDAETGVNNSNGNQYMYHNSSNGTTKPSIVSSARVWGEEALALYVKALSLYEQGMAKARIVLSKGASGVDLTHLSSAVAWIRDSFNECLEQAEIARGVMECKSDGVTINGRSVEKIVHDRALEMAEKAGVSELGGVDLASCEASYHHAGLLLEAILQEVPSNNLNNQHDGLLSEGGFDSISSDDRIAIERFLSRLYVQISRIKELKQTGARLNAKSSVRNSLGSSIINDQQQQQFYNRHKQQKQQQSFPRK